MISKAMLKRFFMLKEISNESKILYFLFERSLSSIIVTCTISKISINRRLILCFIRLYITGIIRDKNNDKNIGIKIFVIH